MIQLEDTAQRLIRRIQQADEALIDFEPSLGSSFQEIQRQVKAIEKQRQRRYFVRWSFSAAAVALVAVLFAWFGSYGTSAGETDYRLAFMDSTDVCHHETIQLVVPDQSLALRNGASLVYDAAQGIRIQPHDCLSGDSALLKTKNQLHQLIVPYGKHACITLADGTRMQVNSGSKVVYPDVFADDQREILVEGEVYLEVAKKNNCPFLVKTQDFQVKVLGTAFNVSAYRDEAKASVVLVNGSVEVEAREHKAVLVPNQLADIQAQGIQVENVDAYEYVCWKDHLMLLRDRSLKEVWKKLERYYDCRIHSTPKVDAIHLSGKLDLPEKLSDVMTILSTSAGLDFTIQADNQVYITLP